MREGLLEEGSQIEMLQQIYAFDKKLV